MPGAEVARPEVQVLTRPVFEAAAFQAHVEYLASDELEGRAPGTDGIEKAAEYIAREFARAGLEPAGEEETFFQTFDVAMTQQLGDQASLVVDGAGAKGVIQKDYVPFPFSSSEAFEGPLAFAGYGITHTDEEYDDYAGFDAAGKVLLMLRYEPHSEDPAAEFGGKSPSRYATFERKAAEAADRGATAILIVNPPLHRGEEDALYRFDSVGTVRSFGLPMLHVTRDFAQRLLDAAGAGDLVDLQRALDARENRSTDLEGLVARGEPGVVREHSPTRNVIGLWPGRGPLADEVVVIGAHYDHLGIAVARGGRGHSHTQPEGAQPEIHNGADDNASGTAGLIELARALARHNPGGRSLLFIAFSAEEIGLLGSNHFVNHPTVPLEKIAAMLNMDMIGRLRDDRLQVFGTETAPDFETLVQATAADAGLEVRMSGGGFGPSDHTSFYKRKIPVLHFFTGIHNDYHRPSDTAEKINAEGGAKVMEVVYRVAQELATAADPPEYVAVPERGPARTGLKVRMGIMPSYVEDDEPGMTVDGVSPGSPAERAGLQEGDRLLMIGEHTVNGVYNLMDALAHYEPGDEASLTVLRDGERIQLPVKFEAP